MLEAKPKEGKEKKELVILEQKIEEVKAIKDILLMTINNKQAEHKKQQANFAKVVLLRNKQTEEFKELGLDNLKVFEEYNKFKEELATLQSRLDHMSEGRNKRRKMKLQVIEGYQRINGDMIVQIDRQKQLLEEQQLFVEDLEEKEAEYKYKRELQKRQYQVQLEKLKEHYTMTNTLAELELLSRTREPAKTETYLNRSTRAMETEDHDESPAPEKGTTPSCRNQSPPSPPRRAALQVAPARKRSSAAQTAGPAGSHRGVWRAQGTFC